MTLKSHDLAHIRSVVLAGHAGARQDHPRGAGALSSRRDPAARPGRRRHGAPRPRARGAEAAPLAEPRGRDVRARRARDHRRRHARLPGLRGRDDPGVPRRGRGAVRGRRVGRRRGGPRDGGQDGPGDRDRGLLRPQQVRPRERGPVGARSTRCARRSATRSRRSTSRSAPRTRSSGYVDLVHRKAYRFEGGKEVEIPVPAELADEVARRRDQLLEAAAEADDDVFEKYLGEEEISRRRARRVPPQGRPRVGPRAGARGVGGEGHRPQRAARRDRPLPPLARRGGPVRRDRQGAARTSRSRRTAGSSWSGCSRPPPTRSSAG